MLNKDSFNITINSREYLSLEQFQQRGYGTIKFTGDNSFEVVIIDIWRTLLHLPFPINQL